MNQYPHMCRMDHEEIGWRGDDERCPVCRARDEAEAARAEAAALRGAAQFALEILPALREDLDPREEDHMANVGLVMACVDRLQAALAAKLEGG